MVYSFVVLAAFALVLTFGVLAYAGRRMGHPPSGNPAEVLAGGLLPSERPVLVCLGDSITAGSLGADWVSMLRERLGQDAIVVNAGVGGQVTWDLRQRLEEVGRCRPDAVVLLVGSNDAVGALGGSWASFYKTGRPQAPSLDWFAEQYDALLSELSPLTPQVACLTLPPLGEDPTTDAAGNVRRQNEAVRAIAARHQADLLEVHDALWEMRSADRSAGVPFLSGLTHFMRWSMGSGLRNGLLGHSWDRIGKSRGLLLTADTIHPSDRAAEAMVALIEPWARSALR